MPHKDPKKAREYRRKYDAKNREKINKKERDRYAKNKEKESLRKQEFYQNNKSKVRARNKKWREENKDKIKIYNREYARQRRQNISYRILNALRTRLWYKLTKKKNSTIEITGCSLEFLIEYLESKFQPGMTWENYGNPNGDHSDCWHIDHIKPCCSFDLTDPEQQKQCFHYTNLQPLWGKENLSKNGRYIERSKE